MLPHLDRGNSGVLAETARAISGRAVTVRSAESSRGHNGHQSDKPKVAAEHVRGLVPERVALCQENVNGNDKVE